MTSFTVFPSQSRPAGTYTSASATFDGSPTVVGYALVSSAWGTADPSITVTLVVQQSFDGGATWKDVIALGPWRPGQVDKFGNPPSGGFPMDDASGSRLAQAVLTLSGTLTLGVNGSTSPLV